MWEVTYKYIERSTRLLSEQANRRRTEAVVPVNRMAHGPLRFKRWVAGVV